MNEENDPQIPEATEHDTPPQGLNSPAAKKSSDWEMPAPVFRVSDGQPVKKFVEEVAAPPAEPTPADEALAKLYARPEGEPAPLPTEAPALPPTPDIKPQPEISEQFPVNEAVLTPIPDAKPAKKGFRVFLTVFGMLGMVLFAIIFLGLVYFLFFYKPQSGSGF